MGSCCSGDSSHSHCGSHHHHHQGGCGCGSSHCHCPSFEEGEYHEEECCSSEKLFEIADCAWAEALKEKIKLHILATDTKLDELAKIVAEANHKRWKRKMEKERFEAECDDCAIDFEEKLFHLFSCHGDSCKTDKK